MAASGLEHISKILECAICLDTVTDPRLLNCNHCYCKQCLDTLLEFTVNDGSAIINCPKGCRDVTTIDNVSTTNNLPIDFMLKGVIDVIKKEATQEVGSRQFVCTSTANCKKDIMFYCTVCDIFLCESCSGVHSEGHKTNLFVPVIFDDKQKMVKLICKEHCTEALQVCCNTMLVCQYCVQRIHKQHPYNSIEQEAVQLKGTLHNDKLVHANYIRNHNTTLCQTERDIRTASDNLDIVLKKRKLDCFNDYINYLDKEEKMIKEKFNNVTKAHLESMKVEDVSEFYTTNLSKESWKLVLQKNPIMGKVNDCRRAHTKGTTKVSVSISNHSFHSRRPLGQVDIRYGDKPTFDLPCKTFECKFPVVEDTRCTSEKTSENIQKLNALLCETSPQVIRNVDGVVNIRNSSSSSSSSSSCANKRRKSTDIWEEVTPVLDSNNIPDSRLGNDVNRIAPKKKAKISIDESIKEYETQGSYYIESLIREKKNEELSLFLSERPDVISEVSGSSPNFNQAIHMAAKYNNLQFMKQLVQHDVTLTDAKNAVGCTALHVSALHPSSYPCSKWLVESLARMFQQDNEGFTPLHNAVSRNDVKTIALLLNRCTCRGVLVKDKYGNNALDLAKEDGCRDALRMLQKFLHEAGKTDNGQYAHCKNVEDYRILYKDY